MLMVDQRNQEAGSRNGGATEAWSQRAAELAATWSDWIA
jgi:hypothetical protein